MMRKLITRSGFLSVLALFAVGLTGCEFNEYNTGADMATDKFTVEQRHWIWNNEYLRYEYAFDWNQIDEYMFETGVVTAGVYVEERYENSADKYWVLRSLPFVHSYPDRNGTFTQTIGFDISYPSRQIIFYIQSSDLSQTKPAIDNYEFKVTLFWQQ